MMNNLTSARIDMGRKNTILSARSFIVFLGLLLWLTPLQTVFAQTTESFTNPGTHTFTVPAGVTEITVEAWGGGGGGGRSGDAGGGGGGGAYARKTVSVNPGEVYTIIVGSGGNGATDANGTAGSNSRLEFAAQTILLANGGLAATGRIGGSGGAVTAETGVISFSGGKGGDGDTTGGNNQRRGGGGGGSAFPDAPGGDGQDGGDQSGGAGGDGEGDGGSGGQGNNNAGNSGQAPGGGGGGGGRNGNGGAGANGQVLITYTETVQYTLSINITGSGTVEVDGTPYTAPLQFDEGTSVSLEALADAGWEFDGWSGDLSSANPTESITMDDDKTITASFEIIPDPELDLRIYYLNMETDPTTQTLQPFVRIHNEGDEEVALSDLTFRYWFTSEPPGQDVHVVDWAVVGAANVLGSFSTLNGERYLEVGFTDNATIPGSPANTLPAGLNTGEIQGRIHDDGWALYDQTNDYSWDPAFTTYAEYTKITLYHKGKLVWGTPPAGATEAEQMTITEQPGLTTAGVTMSPVPTVFLEDAFGEPVAGVDVTVSLNKNSFSGGSTTVVSTDSNGLAIFDNLRINAADNNYRITFSANAPLIGDLNSALFDVTPADPDNMTVTTQPTNTTAGETIGGPPEVQITDAFGNPVPGTNVTVTLNKYVFESGTTTVATNGAGIAQFNDLIITQAAENFIMTFNADATGVDNVNSSSFNITTAAPDQMTIITQPQESVTEGVISGPPTVRLTDAFGNLIQGIDIEVSEASGYVFDAGTLVRTTNSSGLAIFNDLQINTVGEDYQLVFDANAPDVDDVLSDFFDIVPPAGSMTILTQPTNTTAGETISPSPAVLIKDGLDDPIPGIDITVSLNQFGFAHGATTITSDGSGVATFSDLIIQAAASGYEITFNADLTGISDVFSDPFDVAAANAASMSVSTQPANTTAGQAIGGPPAVTIVDAFGNPVSGVPITVSTNKNDFDSGTITVNSNSQGLATFADLVITTADTGYQLEFDADAAGVNNIQSASFNIIAAAANNMTITVQPTESTAGDPISPSPTVYITDIYDNPKPGVDVTAALNKNNFTGGSSAIVTTNSNGLAEFSNLVIIVTDTDYQITFSATGLDPVTSDPFSIVQPDPPFGSIRLQYENNQTNVLTNQIEPYVRLFNDSDVYVSFDELTVRYWFTSEPAGDDLYQVWWLEMGEPDSNVTGSFDEIAGEYYLEMAFSEDIVLPVGLGGDGVSSNILPPGGTTGQIVHGIQSTDWGEYDQSNDYSWDPNITTYTDYQFITVYYKGQLVWGIPPAAAEGGVELEIDQQPTSTFVNTVIEPPITVRILDRDGNLAIYDDSTEVSIAIANDPSGNAELSGTTQVTASGGIAVFDDLSIDNPGAGYTLEVTAGEMDPDISDPFDIESDEPANITFIADPEDPVAGETSLLTATVTNATDTPLESIAITFSIISGNGSLSVISAFTNAAGQATTTYTTATTVEAANIQAVVDADPAIAETASVSSVAGPPTQLAFAVQPNNSSPGIIINPPVTVRIEDQYGNLVTNATDIVQMAIDNNPGGGTLSGDLNVAAVNGVATFDDLSIDEPAEGYTLIASSGSLTSAVSEPFDIAAGAPAKLEFDVQPTNTVAGEAIAPAITVRILDATNTWVETATNTITLSIVNNPGSGNLSGTISKAATGGVATFDDISIDKVGEGYTLAATSSGLSSDTSDPFDILVADAANMVVTVQPPAQVTAGTVITPSPAVLITDDFGNPVEGVDVSISLNKNDFDSGTTTISTDATGVAEFSGLVINTSDTAYEIIFDANAFGVNNVNSNPFDVTAADANNMIITIQPLHSVAGDFILGPPTVQVRDAFNNPVPGISVSVSLNQNSFSSGTTARTTNAAGNAVFNDLIINAVANNYQIIFNAAAPGVSNVTSDQFNIVVDRTISGTILDNMGNPVAGVSVSATSGHIQTVTTNAAGFYQFTGIQAGNRTVNITPSLAGYTFDPPNRSVSNNFSNTPNVTGQDFTALAVAATYFSRQSGNWNLAGSWSTTGHAGTAAIRAPDPDDTVIIGNNHTISLSESVTNNVSVSVENSGVFQVATHNLSGTGSFTLAAGATLVIGSPEGISISGNTGNIRSGGTRSFSEAANYTYNGTALQQTGNGLPAIVNNLTINNSNNVEALSDLVVDGQLVLTNGILIMPPGSSLVTHSVTGSGQVRMQQEITGGKGWRMVASPVNTNYADLFQGFVTQGFDGSDYPDLQPNILWFDETIPGTTNMGWLRPNSINDPVAGGRGHFQYIFNGAELPENGGTYDDLLPVTMSATGREHMSDAPFIFDVTHTERPENTTTDTVDIPAMNTGWNLVGNPTTASLDWEASGWTRENMDMSFYIWVAGANDGEGGFMAWNSSITDIEDPDFVPDIDNDGLIAPFQAFWVRANAPSPVFSMTHAVKTTGAIFEQNANNATFNAPWRETVPLALKLQTDGLKTHAYITFSDKGKTGEDLWDAYQLEPMGDTWLKLFTTTSDHHLPMVINSLPIDFGDMIHIPVYVDGARNNKTIKGSYSLSWSIPTWLPANWRLTLMDHEKKESIPMQSGTSAKNFEIINKESHHTSGQSQNRLSLPRQVISGNFKQTETSFANLASGTNSNGISFTPSTTQLKDIPRFSIVITIDEYPDGYIALTPELLPPYPNPASRNSETTIRFSLVEQDHVTLRVLDLHGRHVHTLANKSFNPGIHYLSWFPGSLNHGIYFVVLQTNQTQRVQKLILGQ